MANKRPISPRQRIFAQEYLVDHNATKACIRAGYSEKSAHRLGSRLLKHPNVQTLINKKTKEKLDKLEIRSERVLEELAAIAFADLRSVFDKDGNLLPIQKLDDASSSAISGFDIETSNEVKEDGRKVTKVRIKNLKRWDKVKALELLGKYLVLWTDKVVGKVEFDIDTILKDLSGSTRGLPSLMPCNAGLMSGDDPIRKDYGGNGSASA